MRSEREFLADVLGRLNGAGLQYMLTGSMASNYWGIPRTTHDLDVVLVFAPNQVSEFLSAFSTGFFIQPESVQNVFRPPFQFNLLDEKSAFKADFWLLREREFDRASFARRVLVKINGIDAWIVTAEDIILHKLLWNQLGPSERQLRDAAGVCQTQGSALDLAQLRMSASSVGVQDDLERLLSGEVMPKST